MEATFTGNGRWLMRFIILFQIFQLSHAHDINCNVTQDGGRTLYAVPRMEEAKDCHHSWINVTGHVLANHDGQMDELVEMNTNYSLRTTECFPVVRYEQNCLSEDSLHEATCNTSCTAKTNPDREEANTRLYWMTAVSIITILAVCLLFWIFTSCCRHEAGDSSAAL
ncbi:hypothetical protein E3U43_009663 [Larimichthys crocea]|uniref:Uncharacterized protein n=1 Tax=Larimichthys crocea TaxID=215358 RepID=A0ACD3QBA9_LARCR|nr:hypothetical protein E3U43_009663 [Larimichthys crocea]